MADISKITPPGSQTTYNLKDATAREQATWNTNNGVKNLSPFNSGSNTTGYNYVTGEGGFSAVKVNIPSGEYIFIASANNTGTGNDTQMRFNYSDGTYIDAYTTSGSSIVKTLTFSKTVVSFGIYCNVSPITFSNVAIIPKSLYDADSTYQPYAMSNAELTNNIITVYTEESKNIIDTDIAKLVTLNPSFTHVDNAFTIDGTLTFTVSTNGKITVTGSIARAVSFMLINGLDTSYSGYILSGGTALISIICQTDGSPYTAYATSTSSSGVTVSTIPSDKTARIVLSVPSGTYSDVELSPMLCSSTSWDMLSQTYQPYALSNAELTAKERTNENNILTEQGKTMAMSAGGTDYIVVNGKRIYVGDTEPTGTIPEGSLWLNTAVINP